MPATHHAWTPREVDRLREVYEGRAVPFITSRQLAEELGRNRHNVSRKARSLGLTDPHRRRVAARKQPPPPTYATDAERRAAQSERMKTYIAEQGHPRGWLGMKHTPETLAILGAKSRAAWADPGHILNSEAMRQKRSNSLYGRLLAAGRGGIGKGAFHTRAKGGRRADLGDTYFRSMWEANYARFLNFLKSRGEIVRWAYESRTFTFDAISRGTRSYTPDFEVVFKDRTEWHEVKGWMDQKSRTRLERMARYYPTEVVKVIDGKWFKSAVRGGLAAVIPGWEKGPL